MAETNLEVTVCFLTTQIGWQEQTDVLLLPNVDNGIKKQSLIRTSKIATIYKVLAKGPLGKLSQIEISELDYNLRVLLQL